MRTKTGGFRESHIAVLFLLASGCSPATNGPYPMNHDSFRVCEKADGTHYYVDSAEGKCHSPSDNTHRCVLPKDSVIYVRTEDECKMHGGWVIGSQKRVPRSPSK